LVIALVLLPFHVDGAAAEAEAFAKVVSWALGYVLCRLALMT
jgi:hypothetical protein